MAKLCTVIITAENIDYGSDNVTIGVSKAALGTSPYHCGEDTYRVGADVEITQTSKHVELKRECPDRVVAHGQPR